VVDWGVVCLHVAPLVQLFASADSGWPPQYAIMSSICQSAATLEIVKRLLVTSLAYVYVSSAIPSTRTFVFTLLVVGLVVDSSSSS